jgi:hypothetical protein
MCWTESRWYHYLFTHKINLSDQAQVTLLLKISKGKGKVIPLQARCGQRYSSTLPWPWHQKGVSGQQHAPTAIYPRERPGTHCTGDWVGPRTGLDRCWKSRPMGIRSPDRPARNQSLYRLSYQAQTKDQYFRFSVNICSPSTLVRGIKKRFAPGSEPAFGGPDYT